MDHNKKDCLNRILEKHTGLGQGEASQQARIELCIECARYTSRGVVDVHDAEKALQEKYGDITASLYVTFMQSIESYMDMSDEESISQLADNFIVVLHNTQSDADDLVELFKDCVNADQIVEVLNDGLDGTLKVTNASAGADIVVSHPLSMVCTHRFLVTDALPQDKEWDIRECGNHMLATIVKRG